MVKALGAGRFGDSTLRRLLSDAQGEAEDRYAYLRDERDAREESGQPWPTAMQYELNRNRLAARTRFSPAPWIPTPTRPYRKPRTWRKPS